MTNDQIQYQINSNKCRAMGHYLELLVSEMIYYDQALDVFNKQMTLIKIADAREDINALFDVQCDLYFDIQAESERLFCSARLESIRMVKV